MRLRGSNCEALPRRLVENRGIPEASVIWKAPQALIDTKTHPMAGREVGSAAHSPVLPPAVWPLSLDPQHSFGFCLGTGCSAGGYKLTSALRLPFWRKLLCFVPVACGVALAAEPALAEAALLAAVCFFLLIYLLLCVTVFLCQVSWSSVSHSHRCSHLLPQFSAFFPEAPGSVASGEAGVSAAFPWLSSS